jgi:hypothetical protein
MVARPKGGRRRTRFTPWFGWLNFLPVPADMPFVTGLLTTEGKRHVRRMLQSLTQCADSLERQFRVWVRKAGCDPVQANALAAITPAAAARSGSLEPSDGRFWLLDPKASQLPGWR